MESLVCYLQHFPPKPNLILLSLGLMVFSSDFRVHQIFGTLLHAAYNKKKEDRCNMWSYHLCYYKERDDSNSEFYCAVQYGLF